MILIPLLITAGVFAGVSATMVILYHLLAKFRPSAHQISPPPPPKSTAEDRKKVLQTIPAIYYTKKEEVLECSVCLSSVEEGDKVRFLPDCRHGFHARCIDEWLRSRLSCPFCRSPVKAPAKSVGTETPAVGTMSGLRALLSIKIGFWRNRGCQSSLGEESSPV